ncbi:UDP-N-acetylmuramate--L-alanine ligase, partial [Mycobacterium montefiorense]
SRPTPPTIRWTTRSPNRSPSKRFNRKTITPSPSKPNSRDHAVGSGANGPSVAPRRPAPPRSRKRAAKPSAGPAAASSTNPNPLGAASSGA